jgi:Family of unknown function (DUF5996)
MPRDNETWPDLPLETWKDTFATLHLWTQIVGKIRLARSPWLNHSWHTTLYVTSRGLCSSLIPYEGRSFELEFNFISHQLDLRSSDGRSVTVPLRPQTVATFYNLVLKALHRLDLDIRISRKPCELPDAIPFDRDEVHGSYDAESAQRFWRVLVQVDRVFKIFRTRFIGKGSPVHFFWGAADLAVTRFSGRTAPEHPGGVPGLADWVTREAYSHEVSSCGFWPGGGALAYPMFYSYAYPEPAGFPEAPVGPEGAFYSTDFREFVLPYDRVAGAASPDDTLLEFLQTTYEAAAKLGGWDRASLERARTPGPPEHRT